MTTENPPTPQPIDNDREVRALAVRFAIDVQDKIGGFLRKENADPNVVTRQILSDAEAFDAFIRRGMILDRSTPEPVDG